MSSEPAPPGPGLRDEHILGQAADLPGTGAHTRARGEESDGPVVPASPAASPPFPTPLVMKFSEGGGGFCTENGVTAK